MSSAELMEFLRMGGYGVYVWPCYAAALLMKVGLLWYLLRRRHLLQEAQ